MEIPENLENPGKPQKKKTMKPLQTPENPLKTIENP